MSLSLSPSLFLFPWGTLSAAATNARRRRRNGKIVGCLDGNPPQSAALSLSLSLSLPLLHIVFTWTTMVGYSTAAGQARAMNSVAFHEEVNSGVGCYTATRFL